MSDGDEDKRRARVIRNAVLLGLVAALVYGFFIFMQYQRSRAGM